jgi:hypothetical protein
MTKQIRKRMGTSEMSVAETLRKQGFNVVDELICLYAKPDITPRLKADILLNLLKYIAPLPKPMEASNGQAVIFNLQLGEKQGKSIDVEHDGKTVSVRDHSESDDDNDA